MDDTSYIIIPGENFPKLISQIYRTQLLSGHCSKWDISLRLLAEPVTSYITNPEFINKCHHLVLETSLEGLVLFSHVDYLRFMS